MPSPLWDNFQPISEIKIFLHYLMLTHSGNQAQETIRDWCKQKKLSKDKALRSWSSWLKTGGLVADDSNLSLKKIAVEFAEEYVE